MPDVSPVGAAPRRTEQLDAVGCEVHPVEPPKVTGPVLHVVLPSFGNDDEFVVTECHEL